GRQDLVEGGQRRQAQAHAAAPDQGGAQEQGPGLAGQVLAQVADVVGAQGRPDGRPLSQAAQQPVPKEGGGAHPQQVEQGRQQQPARVQGPAPQLGLLQVAPELPADHEQDGGGQ